MPAAAFSSTQIATAPSPSLCAASAPAFSPRRQFDIIDPEICLRSFCNGWRFAALAASNHQLSQEARSPSFPTIHCVCSNDLVADGFLDANSPCDYQCPGFPLYSCGNGASDTEFSIYQLSPRPHLLVPRATEYVALNPVAPTSDGPQIAVDVFKYDGFTFSGSLWVKSTPGDKAVAIVYMVNDTASANDTNILAAVYQSLNTSSGYESWTFSAIVPAIDQFYALCRVNDTTIYVDNNATHNYRVILPSDLPSYNPTFLVVAIAFYGVIGFILVLLGLNMLGYTCVRTETNTGAPAAADTRRKRNRDDPALHAAVAIEPQYPLSLRHPSFDMPVVAVIGDARFYPVDADSTTAAIFQDGGMAPSSSQLPQPPTLSRTTRSSSPSVRSAGSLTFTRPPPPPSHAAAGSLSDVVAGAHRISFPLPYEMRGGGLAHGNATMASATIGLGGAGPGGDSVGGSGGDRNTDDSKSLFSLGSLV